MQAVVKKENLLSMVKGKSIHFVGQASPALIDITKLFWAGNASLSISTKQEDVSELPTHLDIFNYTVNTESEAVNKKLGAYFEKKKMPLWLVCTNHENNNDIFERLTIVKDLLHNNEGSVFLNFVGVAGSALKDEDLLLENIRNIDIALNSLGFTGSAVKTIYYANDGAVYSKPLYKLVEHALMSNDEHIRYCLLDGMAFAAHHDGLGGKIELDIKPSRKDNW